MGYKKSEISQAQIIDAAIRVLARQGYARTSLLDIARGECVALPEPVLAGIMRPVLQGPLRPVGRTGWHLLYVAAGDGTPRI